MIARDFRVLCVMKEKTVNTSQHKKKFFTLIISEDVQSQVLSYSSSTSILILKEI